MHTHTHTHTHTNMESSPMSLWQTHTHTHTHTHTQTHMYLCVCIYMYVRTYICMYVCIYTQTHTQKQLQGRRGRGVCPPRTLRRPVVYVRTCKKGRHAQTRAPSVRPHVGGVEEEWCRMPLLGLYSSLATRGYLSCKIQSVVGLFCRAYSALCEFMK